MTPERMFHDLLGLGLNWEVSDSNFHKESGTVFLEIKETARLWETVRCPKDGGMVFCYDHTEKLSWRHLNVFQHRCEITCELPRGKCRQCGHIFRVRPPWEGLSTHFTKEFEAFALVLMREMPISKVAETMGETDTRLWPLEEHNGHRHAITQASMDVSRAYQRGVAENCRNAEVVFDKFHLLSNANQAVDK